MKDTAITLTTILRPKAIKECIESISKFYPDIHIYVADQNKEIDTELYERNFVNYYKVPFDCGLPYARNFLLDKVKQKYIVIVEDDFIFQDDSLKIGKSLLKRGVADIVGGKITRPNGKVQEWEGIFIYEPEYNLFIRIPIEYVGKKWEETPETKFYYCDYVPNFWIATKALLYSWNEDTKISGGEHADYFLKCKLHEQRICHCPDMKILHNHKLPSSEYAKLRKRNRHLKYFKINWKVNKFYIVNHNGQLKERN